MWWRYNSTSHKFETSVDDGANWVTPPLDAAVLTEGIIGSVARIATGTPDGTKFVRDDLTLAVPSAGGGVPAAHHVSHESGGSDEVVNINAARITSGTLPDARLSANVALENVGNNFTVDQSISSAAPALVIRDTSQPADAQIFVMQALGQLLRFSVHNDAFGVLATPLIANRLGDIAVGRHIYERGRSQILGQVYRWIPTITCFGGVDLVTAVTSNFCTFSIIGTTVTYSLYVQVTINGGGTTYINIPYPPGFPIAAGWAGLYISGGSVWNGTYSPSVQVAHSSAIIVARQNYAPYVVGDVIIQGTGWYTTENPI